MQPVVIRTERLVLDLPVPADKDRVAEYCRDLLFKDLLTLPWPYEPRHAEFFLGTVVPKGWDRGDEFTWAIREKSDSPLLGVISWRRAAGEIGFWLGAPHRGCGFMTETVTAVVGWLTTELAQPEVAWQCRVGNLASASVARKCGFRYTGERATELTYHDGSHPQSWFGVLGAGDTRDPKPGWPL